MKYGTSIDIDATPDTVWSILTDVERWPEWTDSITRVDRFEAEPLAVGTRVKIKQPLFPAMVWKVTELEPGRSFSWRSRGAGVTSVAEHQVSGDGPVTVWLGIHQRGPFARLLALLTARTTRRYVHMEADGLKRRAERT